ncbi:MAG: glutamate synthase subunit alpha, partial [Deltaproteobacteria bacterium]|nr:glutamate synthase subunit alpha [Deltaproteobacteria bacterium]
MTAKSVRTQKYGFPERHGLYDPLLEKDSCGVGFVTHINGERSHKIVADGISILKNLEHRGAAGSDPKSGDGAGILTQIPHDYFAEIFKSDGISLPDEGDYGIGMIFLPPSPESIEKCIKIITNTVQEEKLEVIGWRRVPTNHSCLSEFMLDMEPNVYQMVVRKMSQDMDAFERKLYVIRRQIEKAIEVSDIAQKEFFYVCSLSAYTIVYKGMFLANQLEQYYLDLQDNRYISALALVHQRYSTNTFPTWGLAQPFRYIAHNGEINTVKGNINWAKSRESIFGSDYFGDNIKKLLPIIVPRGSDSASFDNFFEILVSSGRSMDHSFLMMVPEAWENKKNLDEAVRSFYEYHESLMEPWDGPAAIMFTNGRQIGGGLDRNGLRPVRFVETFDGFFIMASEVGVLDIPTDNIKQKGRLGPGKILLIDTVEGTIQYNDEIKNRLSSRQLYSRWVTENKIRLDDLPSPATFNQPSLDQLRLHQRVFGYTYEEIYRIIKPMSQTGQEPTSSMGNDTPLAVLSNNPKLLYNYFKQHFAQVTNPAIDSIREELVMSLSSNIGGSYNILDETPGQCRMLVLPHPVLKNSEIEQLRNIETGYFRSISVDMGYPIDDMSLEEAIDEMCRKVEDGVDQGYRLIVLSDRCVNEKTAPIPALLAVSSVHHFLIRKNKRGK